MNERDYCGFYYYYLKYCYYCCFDGYGEHGYDEVEPEWWNKIVGLYVNADYYFEKGYNGHLFL